jgi:hypothetical protein
MELQYYLTSFWIYLRLFTAIIDKIAQRTSFEETVQFLMKPGPKKTSIIIDRNTHKVYGYVAFCEATVNIYIAFQVPTLYNYN